MNVRDFFMPKKTNKLTKNKTVNSIILSIVIPSVIGFLITVFCTFLLSYLLNRSSTLTSSVKIYFVISLIIGAFASGILAGRKTELKGIVAGLINAVLFLFYSVIIMLFFSDGKLDITVTFVYVAAILVSAASGIIGANMKRRK